MPLFIHGDGKHTRRYLYAGDAASAFDTILHKGEIGQIYNVDSRDEISNLDLARRLLATFGLPGTDAWIQHTRDRRFNDRRYAVDGTKLRQLGWTQKVTFEEGLAATVDWYRQFSSWWGPIDNTLLSPFPVVQGDRVVPPEPSHEADKESKLGAQDDRVSGLPNGSAHNGVELGAKKRKAELMA